MPELPEVEHARGVLARGLTGARIVAVVVHDARILDAGARPAAVVKALLGLKIRVVERRGKWLRVALATKPERAFFSHLGMTGKWVREKPGAPPVRFEKVRLDVAKGGATRSMRYLDPRLFGRFVAPREDLPIWSELGPDPLVDGIDVAALHAKLARRKTAIKPALLDQKVLAGIGNIYATEALFDARIDPRRPASALTRTETARLARGLDRALRLSIARNTGPSITYVEEANADNPFVVYGNEGTRCPRCKRPLAKIILGGRGTVFCGHCQR